MTAVTDALVQPPPSYTSGGVAEGPQIREASAIEAYNVPLFEVPPMLDVRARSTFLQSHVVCAVSIPAEDGPNEAQLLQRILDHDEEWGWCLQHPFFVVYDTSTRSRAEWLAETLRKVVFQYSQLPEGSSKEESRSIQLLRRLARQCKQVLFLDQAAFESNFAFCCTGGDDFSASTSFFDQVGPLPRCALPQPRIFLAGRQVFFKPALLSTLGVTHVVVNGDSWDVMDGTSGGGSQFDRPGDVEGIRYLKCDIPDRDDDPDLPQVLIGVAQFLAACAQEGGVALVRLHGQSRSASAICAFVMLARQLSVQAAWRLVEEAGMRLDARLVWWEALGKIADSTRVAALCQDAAPLAGPPS